MFQQRPFFLLSAVLLALALTGCARTPQVISIAITPTAGRQVLTTVGETANYTAEVTYKVGNHPAYFCNTGTDAAACPAQWISSAPGVATIDPNTGVATAVGNGYAAITAVLNGVASAPASDLTVSLTTGVQSGAHNLLNVTITPASQSLYVTGQTAQFVAIATYDSAPVSVDVTNTAVWGTFDSAIAALNLSPITNLEIPGQFTAGICSSNAPCNTTITAKVTDQNQDTVVGQATLSIPAVSASAPRELTALTIIPSSQSINLGQTAQFLAIGTFSSSPTTEVIATGQDNLTWGISDPAIASIGPNGVLTPSTCGASSCSATVTATAIDPSGSGGSVAGSSIITIVPGASPLQHTLTAITIIPGTGSQTLYSDGQSAQFIAIGTYNSPPITLNLPNTQYTTSLAWQSSAVGIATIDATSGLATSVGCASVAIPPTCTTTITATALDGTTGAQVTGSSDLTVQIGVTNPNPVPELSIYLFGAGAGAGMITSSPDGVSTTCTPVGAPCTEYVGYFPVNTNITLTAEPLPPATTINFGGWSANCTPIPATNSCTVPIDDGQTVGAIFN